MKRYNELFTAREKAAAFDEIAKRYYDMNFGTMSKSDFETLLFSLYLEQILKKSEAEYKTYSDYTLSKELGISQSKISTLKVRKELQYPYSNFNWRVSFNRVSENAVYENGKIKLLIPDKNLYLEIKNAVETSGGYIEMTLTQNLLQIRPEYFIDLIVAMSETEERDTIREKIKKLAKEKDKDIQFMDKKPLGQQLKEKGLVFVSALLSECVPIVDPNLGHIIKFVVKLIDG